jgi:hypothetical protein
VDLGVNAGHHFMYALMKAGSRIGRIGLVTNPPIPYSGMGERPWTACGPAVMMLPTANGRA